MKVTAIKCLDSSAWLAYFFGESQDVRNLIESDALLITSSLSLFEIKKKLLVLKKDHQLFLDFVKHRSQLIAPEIPLVEKAADLAVEHKLGAMDALLYATSLFHHADFITGDNDFRGLPGIILVS